MIRETIQDIELQFQTNEEVFSPSSVDTGTKAMLSFVKLKEGDTLLDLGCGYGVVGIWAAKIIGTKNVVMCDISETAVQLSRTNAKLNDVNSIRICVSDGLKEITEDGFTYILSNPPYHADFSVPKGFIEDGFRKLAIGGKLLMVTKRQDWYRNKISSVFGGVTVHEKDGYYVFAAQKRTEKPARKEKVEKPTMSKKLQRKMERRGPKKKQS